MDWTTILERFGISQPAADCRSGRTSYDEFSQRQGVVRVGMVGKYVDLVDAYKSLNEALDHAGLQTDTRVEIDYIDAEEIEPRRRPPIATRCYLGARRLR